MAFGKKRERGAQEQFQVLSGNSMDRYSRNSGVYAQKKAEILSEYSRRSSNYNHKRAKKGSSGKKVAIAVVCLLLVALAGVGAAAVLYLGNISDNLSGRHTEQEKFEIQEALVESSFDQPFYMMLMGGDGREELNARTDTNILCRIDPINKQVTMLSIPRDTKITYEGSTMKFNAAFVYGGIAGAIQAASSLTGADISHYAFVDFEGFVALVDAVGGVEVDVPVEIDDWDAGGHLLAGPQTLNGEDALVFARSRAYADGDFTRASNQRLLIEALVKKVLSLPPTELLGVIQQAASCVETDLSLFDIGGLAMQFKDGMTIYSAMVPSTTAMIDDISYVICDQPTLDRMMEIIDAGGDPNTVDNYNGSAIGSSTQHE